MANEVMTGVAVVWGLSTGATGTGMGTFLPQSSDFAVEGELIEVRNSSGEVIGQVHFNPKQTLSLEVIPTGASKAAAKTANILPLPGAVITVTDADDTEMTGVNTGKYIFLKGSKKKSNTDVTKLTFELMQYVNQDVTATVS